MKNAIKKKSVVQILKKHKNKLLKNDFLDFYQDLIINPPRLDTAQDVVKAVELFKEIEDEQYSRLKKERDKPCIGSEEMPISRAFELITREHFLRKVDVRTAEGIRKFIFGMERLFTAHVGTKPVSLHIDPEAYTHAEVLMLKYLIHQKDKFDLINKKINANRIKHYHKLLYELGPEKIRRSTLTFKEEIAKNHKLLQELSAVGYYEPDHHLSLGVKHFYEKSLKHIEHFMSVKA